MVEENPSAYTSISNLGEFGLIDRLTKKVASRQQRTVKGVGDDAAIVKSTDGKVQVYSSDMLVEGIHFDLSYMPLRHLGYKAVAVNVSDIAAMNAQPYGITISIAVSSRFSVEALDELYEGINLACEKYGIDLLGGDTTSARSGLVIAVTAFGEESQEKIAYRSGAQPKDLICVSGDVGAAYAGFLVLDRERQVFLKDPASQPDLTDYDYVAGRQLRPDARMDVVNRLAQLDIQPTAMIDVSDGIASELHHICHQSKKGATIYSNKLPIDHQTMKVGEEFEISPVTFALNGGEDYELLFTVPLSAFDKIKSEAGISIIGHITDDPGQLHIVLDSGEVVELTAQGWEHFPKEDEDKTE
ncbi:MAG: thiamine-phosphate kinase [Bacteroidota bacterium]